MLAIPLLHRFDRWRRTRPPARLSLSAAALALLWGSAVGAPDAAAARPRPGGRTWAAAAAGRAGHGCVEAALNRLQGPAALRSRLADALATSRLRRLRVVHLGDSHVQFGHSTQALRQVLQGRYGDAGPGLLFPTAVIPTYMPAPFASQRVGAWKGARAMAYVPALALGVAGMAALTTEPGASFELRWPAALPPAVRRVRLLAQRGPQAMDVTIIATTGASRVVSLATAATLTRGNSAVVELDALGSGVTVRTQAPGPEATALETTGLSIESVAAGGVIVDTAGVGGARYRAVRIARRFVDELAALEPSVVILDYGTNDYLYHDRIADDLPADIVAAIRQVRAAAPGAIIILTTAQDLVRKRRTVQAGAAFARLVATIAAQEGCLLWDWFAISGGLGALRGWERAGLASRDLIHLTPEGYRTKGSMLAAALLDAAAVPPDTTARWPATAARPASCIR